MWKHLEGENGVSLCLREENGQVAFRCERPMDRDGIYKVWLRGGGGELLLGTLAPEGERLTLSRTLPLGQLHRCGCWPVRGVYCRMAWSFSGGQQGGWRWEEHPERLVDAETARAGEWDRMLLCREGGIFSLAFPLNQRRPIPLTALICLARAGKIGGDLCLIWKFDREGRPVFPEGTAKTPGQYRT